jgi:hypothetical protein
MKSLIPDEDGLRIPSSLCVKRIGALLTIIVPTTIRIIACSFISSNVVCVATKHLDAVMTNPNIEMQFTQRWQKPLSATLKKQEGCAEMSRCDLEVKPSDRV